MASPPLGRSPFYPTWSERRSRGGGGEEKVELLCRIWRMVTYKYLIGCPSSSSSGSRSTPKEERVPIPPLISLLHSNREIQGQTLKKKISIWLTRLLAFCIDWFFFGRRGKGRGGQRMRLWALQGYLWLKRRRSFWLMVCGGVGGFITDWLGLVRAEWPIQSVLPDLSDSCIPSWP